MRLGLFMLAFNVMRMRVVLYVTPYFVKMIQFARTELFLFFSLYVFH